MGFYTFEGPTIALIETMWQYFDELVENVSEVKLLGMR